MFHLHIRYVAKSTGASTSRVLQYIARFGRYASRGDKVREVISLNMPFWARDDIHSSAYWKAADSLINRANARSAYVVEFALPKRLSPDSQRVLVVRFASELAKLAADGREAHGAVPLTLAIHEGHGRNPHVHLMLSSSINDSIRRSPSMWFMRHNSKNIERGGAKRSRVMAKTAWLVRIRELWADFANQALVAHELSGPLDHRSHAERGLRSEPEIHLGPSAAYLQQQGRPAPRVQRLNSVKARNKALATLQSEVELSRQKLIELNELQLLETHACLVWRAFNQNNWEHILAMHPLAGDATSLRSVATSYVIEADIANIKNVHDDARSDSLIGRVLASVGDRWDSVRTPAGLWLIKPNCDQVILVGLGYVATDGTDEEAVQALLTAASQLPFRFPIVGVSKNISSLMTTCMDRMGLNWSVRSLIKTRIAAALKLK